MTAPSLTTRAAPEKPNRLPRVRYSSRAAPSGPSTTAAPSRGVPLLIRLPPDLQLALRYGWWDDFPGFLSGLRLPNFAVTASASVSAVRRRGRGDSLPRRTETSKWLTKPAS